MASTIDGSKEPTRENHRFRDRDVGMWDLHGMATLDAVAKNIEMATEAELREELGHAEQDFASGDFIDFTVEELDRRMAAGEWPWPNASSE